ncbi:hypothetical protein NW766_005789 [Fusarium irregulare]|uniref:Uncharacterized protein n=1 Tax=Fusarium irregulare TaxID=2494466 RepID=A0A9W8PS09_9HYPO|nr:hypothetical protein NW766_005789 [Fusarium irregulare]
MLRLPPGIDELIASYPDALGAHFACASLPLCRNLEGSLVQMLDNAVPEQASIVLITNDYEVAQHESNSPTLNHNAMVMSFASFLGALELSLGPDGWQSRTSDKSGPCLPQDGLIILDIDPSLLSNYTLTLLSLIYIRAKENKTQLIISFGGKFLAASLQYRLKGLRGNQLQIVDVGAWDDCYEKFNSVGYPPLGIATVLLLIPPNITILPPSFCGYNTVHIIEFDRVLPTQHRWMQLWWAAQPGCGKKSVWLRRQSLDDFLQGGHSDHHLIEGVQLGGFMAAVYDAERWGIDPSLVLEHFIGPADRVDVTRRRLEIQGVIQNHRFALQGQEATTFRAILPVVAYDHCVALFICLDSDPIVRTVKVNLALLLMRRPPLYPYIHDSLRWVLRADGSMVNKLMDCCAGYPKPMAANGPLWLQLGLWNQERYLQRCQATGQFPSEQALRNRLGDISPSKVALSHGDFPTVELRRLELRDRLSATDAISEEQEMEAFEQGHELDGAQQHRIQSHLFRAYMHLTSTSLEANGNVVGYTLLPSMVASCKLRSRLATGGSFSAASLLNGDVTKLQRLFVSSEVSVRNLILHCFNWVMIPVNVIQDWMDANRPNEDLFAVLMATNHVQREIFHEWVGLDVE